MQTYSLCLQSITCSRPAIESVARIEIMISYCGRKLDLQSVMLLEEHEHVTESLVSASRREHDADIRGDKFVKAISSSAVRKWVPWVFAVVIWIELWRSGGYWRYVVFASLVATVVILLAIKRLSGRQGNREK